MVEEVERLRAELQRGPLLDGRSLGDGEIDIFETRRGEDIAAGVTEAGGLPQERRRVQEARGRRFRQGQRHTGHQGWAGERLQTSLAVGDRDNRAERAARLEVDDGRHGPTLHHPACEGAVGLERQNVRAAQHEAMARVEIGEGALRRQIAVILRLRVGTAHRIVVDGLGEGVRGIERQPPRQALVGANPQTIVIGVGHGLLYVDAAEPDDGADAVDALVVVAIDSQVVPLAAYITHLENRAERFVLDIDVVRPHHGIAEIRIDGGDRGLALAERIERETDPWSEVRVKVRVGLARAWRAGGDHFILGEIIESQAVVDLARYAVELPPQTQI